MRSPESPFLEAVESFLRARHDLKPSPANGQRTYEKNLRRIAKSCPRIADFTADFLNGYLAAKLAAGHQTVAHHDGTAAKQLGKWLVRARILEHDPLDEVVIPKQPRRRRQPFIDEQVPGILEAARGSQHSERDVAIVALALACGLRKDELRALQWPADVDLARAIVWIRDAKTEAGRRAVPISPRVCSLVDIYVKDWRPSKSPGALFLTRHGDSFSYDGFGQIFRRVKKRLPASIDFKIHRARNTALTNWRRAGVDIATIAHLAGHTRIEHTQAYLGEITPAELERIPDAFGKFYGGRKAG